MNGTRDPRLVAALVGLGLIVPGAKDPESLWDNVVNRRTFFRKAERSDFGAEPEDFYCPDSPPAADKAYSLVGAWLGERPDDLDDLKLPGSFNPAEADPSLLFWLRAARDALPASLMAGHELGQIGVIAGHVVLPTRAMSEATLALYGREATRSWPLNPFDSPPKTNPFRAVGYSAKLATEALGLKGPAFTVDAACASSLYAVRLALARLRDGSLTLVLTGGLAQADPLFTQLGFSQLRALSRAGVSRPFDRRADGLVVGSGAVALALKRLDRAVADGDKILAVISGVGLSNDRKANALAPDYEGQERAMRDAFADAGLPEDLAPGLFEAHGTSTPVGDAAEMAAIKRFLAGRSCGFAPVAGSIKGNVGHLLSAAGAVSLAKAALALEKKILPPSAGYDGPAEGLDLDAAPEVRILGAPEPWPEPSQGRARVAAVNAFGFGGVNAQAVLEEFRPADWVFSPPAKPALAKAGQILSGPVPTEARAEAPSGAWAGFPDISAFLISARTVLAPWPTYDALARYWLTPEEPPMAQTRRFGGLKTTGYFFDRLTLDVKKFHLPPKELSEALPQQTLAFKASKAAVAAAGLDPDHWPESIDRNRVGVFMGVEIDPRSADYALRWLAPSRAAAALKGYGLGEEKLAALMEAMREGAPPILTHGRVLGALGSFVASRLARFLGLGGPAFTMSEEQDSGLRALREAINMLNEGAIDLALVGVVDTFGDPKTAALAPKTVWVEGAAAMILASAKAAESLKPLAELTLSGGSSRLGPLSGLFGLNRSGFYLRHHLKPLGRGHGFAYWLRNPQDPPRSLEGPGYRVVETPGHRPQPLTVPSDPVRADVWFFIKGQGEAEVRESLTLLAAMAEENPGRDLSYLSKAHTDRSKPGPPRLAMLARDHRELASHLKRAQAGEVDRDFKPRLLRAPKEPIVGDLAWVFPGSGNHYKGLGRGLAVSFPEVISVLETQSENPIGLFQSQLFWEPNHKRPTVREAMLGQVCFGLMGARVLDKIDLRPKAALGYSLGEVSALVATGIWPDRDELYRDLMASTLFNGDLTGELAAPRAFWNWPAHKGLKWLSALIPRSLARAKEALESLPPPHRHRAFILLVNTREEIVAGGEESAVQLLAQSMDAPFFPLEDVAAVHAPVVGPVLDRYSLFHTRRVAPRPDIRLYSCARAEAIEQDSQAIAESMASQAVNGHRFPDLVEKAYADGARFFVEVGPGNSTTRMIKSILGDRPHLAQSMAATAVDEGWTGLNRLLAELWLSGYPISPEMAMLQPTPVPDPRYEVAINLSPPEVVWPCPALPAEATSEPAPAAEAAEDYLSWLDRQSAGRKKPAEPAPPSTSLPATTPPAPKPAAPKTPVAPKPAPPKPVPPKPAAITEAPRAPIAGPPLPKAPGAPVFDRAECLEFAVGSIGKVLGPDFAAADDLPSRVRLPDEPLMFVDRVTLVEGAPKSLTKGRLVTEHDLKPDEWCLEDGYLTPGMSIESGQADLLLSAYLGADFSTKGLANYRLLDAEVVFHDNLPRLGQTAAYDIRINNFFGQGDTLMFRFEFDGSVAGKPLLTMRKGCAGFFTPQALAAGKGLGRARPQRAEGGPPKAAPELTSAQTFTQTGTLSGLPVEAPGLRVPYETGPAATPVSGVLAALPLLDRSLISLNASALTALREGDPGPLGSAVAEISPIKPLLLPGGSLALIDRAMEIDHFGGAYGIGFIRTEADVDPLAWYLTSHFKGDEVMPGTLMYDGCLQSLRLLLLARGWLGPAGSASFQPPLGLAQTLRCRGQVTPTTKTVAYEVHLRETGLWYPSGLSPDADGDGSPVKKRGRPPKKTLATPTDGQPYALADAVMFADGRPIVEVSDMGLRLLGLPARSLSLLLDRPQETARRTSGKAAAPAVTSAAAPAAQPKTIRRPAPQRPPEAAPTPSSSAASVSAASVPTPAAVPPGEPAGTAPERGERLSSPDGGKSVVKVRRREAPTETEPGTVDPWEPSGAQVSVRRPARGTGVFDKEKITQMSTGLLSEALGTLYKRFDDGSFVARLPRAPFDFIDQAKVLNGPVGQVSVGTQVEAVYDPEAFPGTRDWLLAHAGGEKPVMPYAAINEMALQGCGFLAAYMGSALSFPGPMRFRNLGGEAILHAEMPELTGKVITKAQLTKSSVLGNMTIQHYQFSLTWRGRPLYDGTTHFGFHSPETLLKPLGLKANPSLLKALTAPAAMGQGKPYPTGPAWPSGLWTMVDKVIVDSKGAGRVWGRSKVDPNAWFFGAHFPEDPVWPGSLGLEGFLQAAKALYAAKYWPEIPPEELKANWHAPNLGRTHRWLYRGQIVPNNLDVTFGIKVTGNIGDTLIFKGLLWVDGHLVYQIDDFTLSADL
ncbi:MAG: hypothetical protein LBJ61_12990 [Deltaproteobacteria bacterium]|jgi:acyl transferase domain-containing protein/3-hydroxymyristoyl/3-hydroxydecanoyl-(acyl carrier protein) dehydratase|nr:hypothetical protein [Deltaproteobacteria bacterium]